MTQSFSLPQPDSELAFNMMPPWKQSDVAFNLLQTSDVQLERSGQKRRRDPFNHVHSELQSNTMPNERVSNDSEACNNLFGASLDSSFPNERRGFYSSTSGIFPFRAPESNSHASVLFQSRNVHINNNNNNYNADFRNHQRSLDSAEAATAQAMANFQALIDQGRSSGFQAYNHGSGAHRQVTPSFGQLNHGSFELPTQTSSAFDFFNSGGFQDTNPSSFGDSTGVTNGTNPSGSQFGFGDHTTPATTGVHVGNGTYRTNSSGPSLGFGDHTTPVVHGGFRTGNSSVQSLGFGDTATGGVNDSHSGFQDTSYSSVSLGLNTVSETTTWPNLTCQTSVRNNNATSLFAEPQSPCTPRGHRTVLLSEAQEEYLQQMERLNSEALLMNSPPRQSSRGRRLSYTSEAANEERSSTGVSNYNTIFHPFSELDHRQGENSKHLHVYFDESGIPQHVDHVEENTATTTVEESATRGSLQFPEDLTVTQEDSFEPAAIAGPEKENRNHHADQFDLNEVPVISVGDATTPPKTRKKYHPRVAKDKRTYKRRVDGKKTPANSFLNTDSSAKKAVKRRGPGNQPGTQLYDEEGRDSSYPEVVDMDIEDIMVQTTNLHTVTQHDTTVCDCEFCIKLRLERRNSTNIFTSFQDSEIPQSPISPRTFPDSSSNSRRTLFQAPEFSNEAPARRLAFDDNEEPASLPFDSNPSFDDSSPTATVIPQANATAYENVRSFFNARAQASCLQQFNESAAQLGFSWEGEQQQQQGAIVPAAANRTYFDWNPPVTAIVPSSGCGSNSSTFMSRLCPRGILSPQKIAFRDMNAIQRVVYLKGILGSNAQLTMSPESLLRHVHEHLPDDEKPEFQSSLWPIILKPLTEEQMKQLEDYANAEHQPQQHQVVEVAPLMKVRRKPGPKPKKAKDSMAMTLWPGLVTTPKPAKQRKNNNKSLSKTTAAAGRVVDSHASPNHGLELVPYNHNRNDYDNGNSCTNISGEQMAVVAYEMNNKSVVAYSGPFNPVRKRKPRPKVVLDSETVRVWKLLMGKPGAHSASENVSDAEKNELKWEDERRKMKAHALLFIDRMHVVQGDRSFSCWKGSVVDSVVGAFLTQNVNDVLSSSAFMSMRSRFPGRGFRRSPSPTENHNPEPEESPSVASTTPDCTVTVTTVPLESSQESRNSDSTTTTVWNQNQSHESSAASEVINQLEDMNLIQAPQTGSNSQSENSSGLEYQMTVQTEELSSNGKNGNKEMVSVENGMLTELHEPSHGKYNPKTGLTGLERAKIEEKQVTARKSFDFSGLQEEFKPRIAGEMMRKAQPRTEMTEDGVDWEAVRAANVQEVADVIKERGLNWILAGRIKAFLERIHLDYGALDLEWLRSMSTDQTKEFLLSIRGLGLKSVECIRLLTLHHLAFPVDTNVGRICVRLGWVPLEPLPEELQLHLLELYPVQATIQKYLWPRLCKLDQQTLYELHYQMITFGKVFCTKSKPNCNACPMRPECKHFASALSSAKLALPASERPNNGPTLALPPGTEQEPPQDSGPKPPRPVSQYCQPIVEEPMTPESEADMEEFDMEDYPFTVEEVEPDDVDMNICIQAPTQLESIHNPDCCSISDNYVTVPEPISEPLSEPISEPVSEVMSQTIMEDWGGLATSGNNSVQLGEESIKIVESVCEEVFDLDTPFDDNNNNNNNSNDRNSEVLIHPNGGALSHEMVLVPHGASLPVPKLKNVGRLRTVHYVYELPDNHPLLDGLDPREHDDPCTYLLAIWSPGEVPESIPNMNDTVDEENPFAASSSEGEESIKATLLVPCRTAMQGSFPLNGTYFQVNEVFADHASSLQPMLVPRTLLWNLRRRFVFFGTSVTSIFRGMTVEEIQACFWRGYVCVRGFDRVTRAPKPLVGRLHLQAGKASGKGANAES